MNFFFKKIFKSGPEKDFEVVPKVRNVVALEDEFFEGQLGYQLEGDEWDEWEQIFDPSEKKSYSSVLRGLNET